MSNMARSNLNLIGPWPFFCPSAATDDCPIWSLCNVIAARSEKVRLSNDYTYCSKSGSYAGRISTGYGARRSEEIGSPPSRLATLTFTLSVIIDQRPLPGIGKGFFAPVDFQNMAIYLGYLLLGSGALLLLVSWYFEPPNFKFLIFVATMMVMSGLAILQFIGTEAPGY